MSACRKAQYTHYTGQTMGTTYSIKFASDHSIKQSSINQLLEEINLEVSTYIDSSFIRQFNDSKGGIPFKFSTGGQDRSPEHFAVNFRAAKQIYQSSNGTFDPTVMPLVNYWGFGYTPRNSFSHIDSLAIDSILSFVGFQSILLKEIDGELYLLKPKKNVALDFSAIAKGYGVDAVAELLEDQGVKDYLVEIGGELKAKGLNQNSELWRVGINRPVEGAPLDDIKVYLELDNEALASSGNYRNYYDAAGVRFSHTINPLSGYPERSNLLSVSIIARDCIMADACATACMVMGLDKAVEWIDSLEGVEGCLIYLNNDRDLEVLSTAGFESKILKINEI